MGKEKEYVPFGPEWEKELMKHTKKELIERIKVFCQADMDRKESNDVMMSILGDLGGSDGR